MSSLKRGKAISAAKPANKAPSDPIDRLIHEQGLRIKDVYIDKALDMMLLVLNNGTVIRSGVTEHKRLKSASQQRLLNWKLIAGGTGVTWPDLDEDLSLKGFIHALSIDQAIRAISDPRPLVAHATRRLVRRSGS